jgi:glutaredoxin 2
MEATVTLKLSEYNKLIDSTKAAKYKELQKEIDEVKKELLESENSARNVKAELNKVISGLRNDIIYHQTKNSQLSERVKFTTDEANKCFNLHKESQHRELNAKQSELSWKKIAEDAVTKVRKLEAKIRAKK